MQLYINGGAPSYADQKHDIGNFDPTVSVLVTMIIYMMQVQSRAMDSIGNENRRANAKALPKAELKLFSYIMMRPVLRDLKAAGASKSVQMKNVSTEPAAVLQ
jgi:hypothetical protein